MHPRPSTSTSAGTVLTSGTTTRPTSAAAHVLATMDESTYDAGGNKMGADHPISWCKPYDGGRAWMTGMGHFGAHFTAEPDLVQHIVGGVQWASGQVAGDCGGTDWGQFEKVALDTNTSAPYGMDVAPDGRVFFTELVRGEIRLYDPRTQNTSTAITLPVYSGGEDGLLGIALDKDFATNGYLYQYYSPASADDTNPANFFNRISRFTVTDGGPGGTVIDPASEKVLIEVPAGRLPDEPGHTGGSLIFDDRTGDLYIGVGDDVNPHSEPSGGYAPISERPGTQHDARETSANTNDLRGKVLRIHPEADGTYTVPEGNLFARAPRRRCPRSTPWVSATRSGSRSTPPRATSAWPTTRRTTAPTTSRTAAPRASPSGTTSRSRASSAGPVHGQERALP
ncbi:PQQ-dependent sugar dehydrogenase [Oerskovia sp. M15]